jgi:hypothetical protein
MGEIMEEMRKSDLETDNRLTRRRRRDTVGQP